MSICYGYQPGVGDSNGHCGESTLRRDLAAFEAAYHSLKAFDPVDSSRITIHGSSMGSALAPHLANKLGAAGVISDVTFVKTWFEHMLEIEQRIRLFEGDSPAEVARKINEGYIPLYYGRLIEKIISAGDSGATTTGKVNTIEGNHSGSY